MVELYDLATISDVPNGAHSVSEDKVFYGLMDWMSHEPKALETVCCVKHGAMLNVAITKDGKIWRCPACNVGAFEKKW
jgi:hypothetical protein